MNIAMIYAIAALLAIVLAGPVALLAPVLFAVVLPTMPVDEAPAPTETIVEQGDNEAHTRPSAQCAPFVAVYAARGPVSRRPVALWDVSPTTPRAWLLDRNGRPLRGAAMRAATAKAGRLACVSHACPTVAS